MRLRQNVRVPERYREDGVREPQSNRIAVARSTLFNPTLPLAAFPSLPLDRFPPQIVQETLSDNLSTPAPELPALVFRDRRSIEEPKMSEQYDDPGEFVGADPWSDSEEEEMQPRSSLTVS
jgi:hypothetical protein